MREGQFVNGKREGFWKDYYDHDGDLRVEAVYDKGELHGPWVSYFRHDAFAAAACYAHGKRLWEVSDENERARRTCP
jgi:antitoxin component YwqK of YwqJK toxin-antitoxin module